MIEEVEYLIAVMDVLSFVGAMICFNTAEGILATEKDIGKKSAAKYIKYNTLGGFLIGVSISSILYGFLL